MFFDIYLYIENNQQFRFDSLGNGLYRIVAKHSGKVLDINSSSHDNSAKVIQYNYYSGNNQKFRLLKCD